MDCGKWTDNYFIEKEKIANQQIPKILASLQIVEEMKIKITVYIKSAKIFYFLNENSQWW